MIQVMVEASMASEAVERARQAATDLAGQGRENLAAVMYSWGLALEALGQYDGAAEKFQACATSGNPRYASSGRQQVERMEGLKAVRTAEDKKAAQGR
jgi:hypothetical protein